MAGSSVIGALRVVLGADTAALDSGLEESRSKLASFGASVSTAVAAAAAAVAAAAVSMGLGIKSAIDNAEALGKMSQSTGIAVEELSKLQYAAQLSNVGTDALGVSLTKLAKNMSDAAGDGAGRAAQAFKAMGVAVQNNDGTLRSSGDVLATVADRFASYKDGAEKTALALAVFGKAGAAMIPFLNQGSAGFKDAAEEASQFGLVVSKDAAASASEFNDNLTRLNATKQGLYNTIAARLLPTLESLSDQFIEAKKSSTFTADAADIVTASLERMGGQIAYEIQDLKNWVTTFYAIKTLLRETADSTDYGSAAMAKFNATMLEGQHALEVVRQGMTDLLTGAASFAGRFDGGFLTASIQGMIDLNKQVVAVGENFLRAAPKIAGADSAALQNFIDSQNKRIAAQRADAETIGKSADQQAKLRVEYEAQAIAVAKGITLTDGLRQKIASVGDAAAAAALKLQGAQLTQESLAPWDQRNQKLQQYNTLLAAGAISQDTFNAASQKLKFPDFTSAAQQALDLQHQVDALTTSFVTGLASAIGEVANGSKTATQAFTDFAVQFVTKMVEMVVQALIFKAIMTAIGFSGGGEVGTMQVGNQFFPQFAGGGAVMGAGSGTSDSIPAMLSNGEFVVNAQATRQWAPLLGAINAGKLPSFSDGGAVSGEAPSVQMVSPAPIVNINWRGGITDRKALAELIDGLNEMYRNGYKLKVA